MDGMVKVDPIVIGIVKDLEDPQQLGRVRVALTHLDDQLSDWAGLSTLMAGPERGTLFRPEPEDEVLVAFVQGDPTQPYVLGALWNEEDVPPEGGGDAANDLRTIRSRSGHVVRFDDTSGSEKVEVVAASENRRIVLDDGGTAIEVTATDGKILITADADDIEIESGGNVKVKATGDVAIEAGGAVDVVAGGDAKVEAGGSLSLEGSEISITASGVLTLEGSTVKIN